MTLQPSHARLDALRDVLAADLAILCTDEGLVVAASGDPDEADELAGLTTLFDTILTRAERDHGVRRVDEFTLLDPRRGRLIVRPVPTAGTMRFFLVLRLAPSRRWRAHTNRAVADLSAMVEGLA